VTSRATKGGKGKRAGHSGGSSRRRDPKKNSRKGVAGSWGGVRRCEQGGPSFRRMRAESEKGWLFDSYRGKDLTRRAYVVGRKETNERNIRRSLGEV